MQKVMSFIKKLFNVGDCLLPLFTIEQYGKLISAAWLCFRPI